MPEVTQESKAWWQSKTIIGVIVMILGFVVHKFAPDTQVDETQTSEIVALVMETFGSVLAFIGRLKATKPIG